MSEPEITPVRNSCSNFGTEVMKQVRTIEKDKNIKYHEHSRSKSAVFEVLGRLGRERGFRVFHEPCPGLSTDGCEFLLDLVWRSEAGGIELGAECEWKGTADVLYDFRKLLYVKAPVKVLVYWATRNGDDGKAVRQGVKNFLQQYTRHCAGEQYLLLEFGRGKDDRCYEYVIPSDILGEVLLNRLP